MMTRAIFAGPHAYAAWRNTTEEHHHPHTGREHLSRMRTVTLRSVNMESCVIIHLWSPSTFSLVFKRPRSRNHRPPNLILIHLSYKVVALVQKMEKW